MNLNLFDAYNLRARLCVSIFYASPFIFDIICLTHKAFSITEGVILSALCVTVCQALLGIHRSSINGQHNKNTAAELLSLSSALPAGTRARYYRKLASFEPEFQPLLGCISSTYHDVEIPTSNIDQLYTDIISWLRAKTRDPILFRLVYEESINYGYARNMLNLKPIGVGANLLSVVFFGIYVISVCNSFNWSEHGASCLCLVIHLISICYLHCRVNVSSVDAAAMRYARALLETIDIL